MSEQNPQSPGFNYRITQYFLNNNRLTVLAFIMLVVLGVGTGFLLKPTGFPNPEVKIAIVQTLYPGASSETVVDQITIPLEGAIKDVKGVKRFSSTSSNSFSLISITIDEKSDVNSVINKIDSATKSVKLPSGVETPRITQPDVGGPDLILAVSGTSLEQTFEIASSLKKDLSELAQTAKVDNTSSLQKRLVVGIDNKKLAETGVSASEIQARLQTIGESLPVKSNVELDQQNSTLVTTIQGDDLEAIKNLQFQVVPKTTAIPSANLKTGSQAVAPKTYLLQDLAKIDIKYEFTDQKESKYTYHKDDKGNVVPAVFMQVKTVKNTDQVAFTKAVEDKFAKYNKDKVIFFSGKNSEKLFDTNKTNVVTVFSSNDDSQEQVQEVVGGLIGGPLKIDNQVLAQAGWLLGGIQLVFLAMLAFVSWRAALVAAASIPLSLIFSTIYLYLIGESLNTLVLFSLVLVIGLVVDPALVILESIQRKVDSGLRGNEAVLAAIKDVGNGIFLACLTNIIVFLPFGVISGILGQIFFYIPLTIIPATIGSYIVPLVFLAWMGGLILKPNKNSEHNEEKNLWGIAKSLIRLNSSILHGSRWIRLGIILLGLIIPFSIAGLMISTEKVRVATFSTNENANFITISGTYSSKLSIAEQNKVSAEILADVVKNPNIHLAIPFGQSGFSYRLELKPSSERTEKTIDIARQMDTDLQNKYGENSKDKKFYDIRADIESVGPPTGSYQFAISVKSDDLDKLRATTSKVGSKMLELCKQADNSVKLDANCNASGEEKLVTKVDDGFTGKENRIVEVLLDPVKLAQKQATIPNAPLSLLVNQQIRQLYDYNDNKKVGEIKVDGNALEIVMDNVTENPKTKEDIANTEIVTLTGQKIKLSEVATIQEKLTKQTVERVRGQTVALVQARLNSNNATNQTVAALAAQQIIDFYNNNDAQETKNLGLEAGTIGQFSDGSQADTLKSFGELLTALALAIIVSYIVLALFFKSFSQPMSILYTIPLTFIGMFPGLAYFGGGQIGFLEIIGLIILVGIVENVAIFLIDAANQKIEEGWNEKKAISFASGLRFRPVILTKLTAIASLAPLAIFSVFYRSIAVVIMFGLLTSGILSLIATPILFVFFKWLSKQYRVSLNLINKLAFALLPVVGIVLLGSLNGLDANIAKVLQVLAVLLILTPLYYIIWLGIKDKPLVETKEQLQKEVADLG